MQQAYYTTNFEVDKGGNYYYPIWIPDGAPTAMPITLKAPDPSLGNKGLKFDWSKQEWITSEKDPGLQLLRRIQKDNQAQGMITLQIMKSRLLVTGKEAK